MHKVSLLNLNWMHGQRQKLSESENPSHIVRFHAQFSLVETNDSLLPAN